MNLFAEEDPRHFETLSLALRPLREALHAIFVEQSGLSYVEAHRIADALIEAELWGVPTHGLLRVPGYLEGLRAERFNPHARIEIVQRGASMAVIDGDRSLGYLPTWEATRLAVELSRASGVGAVGVRNIGEFGRAAYYAHSAAVEGVVAIVCQNTPPLIGGPGSTVATQGNNPLSFAAPGEDAPIFDAAWSPRSAGELRLRALVGLDVPVEWGYVDSAGNPITDPESAFRSVMPAVGGGKGFGIAVLVDLLAGILTSARNGQSPRMGFPDVGAFVLAVDPAAFGIDEELPLRLSATAAAVRSSGGRWPGDRGRAKRRAALERGRVAVARAVWDQLVGAVPDRQLDHVVATG